MRTTGGGEPRDRGLRGVATTQRLMEASPDPDLLVETSGLTKRYGPYLVAVDGLDLRVRRGQVYGFVGPNGAGKTTTLRMLLGLVRPSSGTAWVLGEAPGTPGGLARVGALVETPALYPFLSGRDNLRCLARYTGVAESRVEETLKRVQLTARANDKVRSYSLGMKQRLGVAAAMLKDPQLLILDEPTNGLDPAGMVDMRALIREFSQGGRSVLLSSHQLSDVQQVCDRVGVIRGGRLVAEGTVGELSGRPGLLVRVDSLEAGLRCAGDVAGADRVQVEGGALLVDLDPSRAAALVRALVLAGVGVLEVRRSERQLEEVFLELTEATTGGAESVRAGGA
jgi:ABC-type multidrug transport system ATPase subunit